MEFNYYQSLGIEKINDIDGNYITLKLEILTILRK
ncbi:hypothetical protein J2810_004855 [Chryseobacterium rhizosphaerae]|nr:hypothetical protein [Chryseobacterium rhizosphaerae]